VTGPRQPTLVQTLVHKSVSAAGWGGYRGIPAAESSDAV
jgi:hypothetical protein